nr:2Fe-2S iron-sulfur cluster-binding protein [Streptomyces sp. SID13726]
MPQGDYDDGATAFVKLPEGGIDALLASADSPLAARGHGYVPPQIAVAPGEPGQQGDGTDPAGPGAWGAPAEGSGWPDPNTAPQGHTGQFTYNPSTTQQWNVEDTAAAPASGHDVTGQWSIPVAGGDLPDESGEFTTSALVEQWGGTPPATLPGGAPAPWATQPAQPWGDRTQGGAGAGPEHGGPGDAGHAHVPGGGVRGDGHGVHGGPDAEDHGAVVGDGHTHVPAGGDGHTHVPAGDGHTRVPLGEAPGGTAGDGHGGPAGDARTASVDEAHAHVPTAHPHAEPEPGPGPSGYDPAEPHDSARLHAPDRSYGHAPADSYAGSPSEAASQPTPGTGEAPAATGGSEDVPGAVAAADGPAGTGAGHTPDAGDGEPAPESADEHTADADSDADSAVDEHTENAERAEEAEDADERPAALPGEEHPLASYVLRVNGVDRPVTDAWIGESLLYVLRERLGLAGAKDGCSQGECGACNVQVDGRLVASCLVPAVTAAGSEVRTVEGLAEDGRPSDVQRALARCGAVQCGFCVPGMAMTVHDLLEGNPAPTELETRQALCGNLCRCSGYRGVVDAVKEVVAEREAHSAADAETDGDEARIPHQAGPGAGGVNPSAFEASGSPGAHEQAYGQGQDGGQA